MPQNSKDNNKIFILGIMCLVLSLGFILFALYILPYLMFELSYNVPEFIVDYMQFLQEKYSYSSFGSKFIVWLTFLIPGLITGYVSYYISHYLDKDKTL
jgi:hypothetical protein